MRETVRSSASALALRLKTLKKHLLMVRGGEISRREFAKILMSSCWYKMEVALSRMSRPRDLERPLIQAFRENIAALPNLEHNGESALAPWLKNRQELRKMAMTRDPRFFLSWDVVRRTMFANSRWVNAELDALKRDPQWLSRWKPALQEDGAGLPQRFLNYGASSGNMIHHAYHLQQFELKTGKNIAGFKWILEFGGGYGSLCRLAHRLGFRGRYIIFDFPEWGALQSFFLPQAGVPLGMPASQEKGAVFCSTLEDLPRSIGQYREGGLLIATWSLSESPVKYRLKFLDLVRRPDGYLLAYQKQFDSVDNIDFFRQWRASRNDVDWQDWVIPHIPGNRYLMGTAK